MKKIFYPFVIVAAAAMTLVSCNEEIENPAQEEIKATHTVKFTTAIDTKTAMTEGAEEATFDWTSIDENNFKVYENGVEGEAIGVKGTDGKMSILAEFPTQETTPESYTYTATLNGAVGNQVLTVGQYDETADVLVAKAIAQNSAISATDEILFQFKRVIALNKVTFSGFGTDDTKITKVVISSENAKLAGAYDVNAETPGWASEGTNEITLTPAANTDFAISNPVYFNCIPTEGAKITFTVTTDKGTYSRTAKSLALNENQLNTYAIPLKAAPCAVENFTATKATTNNYDCSSSLSTDANRSDFDYSWELSAGSATVFQNGVKLGSGKNVGSITSSDILSSISGSTIFTVKVYAASWSNDNSTLQVEYNGTNREGEPANDAITSTTGAYSADDFKAATEFVFEKVEGENSLTISSVGLRVLIDKIGIVKGGELPAAINVESVTLDKSEISIVEGKTALLTATILPENADNKTINWHSDDENVAIVENGLVTGVNEGTTTISAVSDADETKYAECEVTVTKKADGSFSWELISNVSNITEGEYLIATNDKKSVFNGVINSGHLQVSAGTLVSGTFTAPDDACVVTITSASATNTYYLNTENGYIKATEAKSGKLALEKDVQFGWVFSGTNGFVVKGVSPEAYLRSYSNSSLRSYAATSNGNDIFLYKKVAASGKTVSSIAITTPPTKTIYNVGETFDPEGMVVTATFSDNSTESVTGYTYAPTTALSTSDTAITVTYQGKTATQNITVNTVSVTGITLIETADLWLGETLTLTPTIAPDNATNKSVTWSSIDETVATVSNGVVTPVAAGTTTITATTVDGNKTATCAVTVKTIANTEETAYTAVEAIALYDAQKDLNTPVYIKGTVSKTDALSSGTINIYIDEGFELYKCKDINNVNFTSAKIAEGGSLVAYGKLTKFNSTYELGSGCYLISYEGPTVEEIEHGETSISDFLSAGVSSLNWYTLTGTISGLESGDQYGNFNITDDTGSVYVYGVLSEKGGDKKSFQSLVSQHNIINGGTITIIANRGEHNGTIEATNAYFVSYTQATDIDAEWSVSPTAINVVAGSTATATITTNYDGTLSVSSSDPSKATATISENTITVTGVAAGTATITVSGAKTDIFNAISKEISVTVTEGGGSTSKYIKVTSTANLTDGTYLIVCEDQNVAFNGGLSTLDAVSNTISVTISNGEIESNATTNAAAFTFTASNGSFLGLGGKYFGNSSNSNGLTSSTTALTNTVSINDGNADIVSSGGAYLRYNATSGQTRFRYFKSSTYSAQKAIQLYKLSN